MNDFQAEPRVSAFRTPLGVIGGFASISEAILIASISLSSNLTTNQRWALILFVFVLLFATLYVFKNLVTHHHKNLYAPFEFRSDEAFTSTMSPAEIQFKRFQEASQYVIEDTPDPTSMPDLIPVPEKTQGGKEPKNTDDETDVLFAVSPKQTVETFTHSSVGRIIDAIEDNMASLISKSCPGILNSNVKLRKLNREIWIDGVYGSSTGSMLTAIEIKHLPHRQRTLNQIFSGIAAVDDATSLIEKSNPNKKAQGLLILVTPQNSAPEKDLLKSKTIDALATRRTKNNINILVYDRNEISLLNSLPTKALSESEFTTALQRILEPAE